MTMKDGIIREYTNNQGTIMSGLGLHKTFLREKMIPKSSTYVLLTFLPFLFQLKANNQLARGTR